MADGYARASGGVGVAMATSGPGATNMVTGIATAMLDSSPVVCITGQVSSKLLGSDAFQEMDITGITMPITKHNVVVSARRGYRAHRARSFHDRELRPPRPGSGGHHQGCAASHRAISIGTPALPSFRPNAMRNNHDQAEFDRAVELLNSAKRP